MLKYKNSQLFKTFYKKKPPNLLGGFNFNNKKAYSLIILTVLVALFEVTFTK